MSAVHVIIVCACSNSVSFLGTNYAAGMLVCCGSTAGLPDFAEVMQIMVVHDKLAFVVKLRNTRYNKHLRSYELKNTSNVQLIEQKALADFLTLAVYSVEGRRLVTLKHYICLPY